MRRLAAPFLIVVLLVVSASAHSLLLDASPAAGSVLAAPPRALALRFNNRIEKRLSRLRLVDEQGQKRELEVEVDGAADRLTAPVTSVAPGRYRVEWQVLSTDGHVVSGRYSFTVK